MAFSSDVFKRRFRGAGYFAGSLEEQPVLAMTWDSLLFPEQSANTSTAGHARLSVYVSGPVAASEAEAEKAAREAVRAHMGIVEEPVEVRTTLWADAIPQYNVGHYDMMRTLD